ncbi:MAG: hypothetical protein H0V97_00735 [Actinobacteria bacterium]|nr:hypothetical protein [Actinomycetota bacterium]
MRGRTTLASLAGSALAVVSAGVLVAFSLTAQRAALDAGVAGRPSLGRPEARTGDQIQPIRLAELPDERSSGETSPRGTAADVARPAPGSVAAVIETVLEATIPGDGRLAEAPSNRAAQGAKSNDPAGRDFPTFGDANSPALRQEVELRSSDIVAAFAPPPRDEPTGPAGSGNAGGNGEEGNDPDGGTGPEEEEGPDASPKPKRDKKPKKDAKPEKEKDKKPKDKKPKDKKPKDKERSDKPEKPRDKPGGHGHDDDGHQGNGHEDHGNGNGNGHDEDGGQGDGDGGYEDDS